MYIYQLLTNNGSGITREGLLNVVAFIVALVFALTLHEIAHGLVALWNGDDTAKLYGRLTLNPVKHFDIVGFVLLLLMGFGWAKPVPINPNNFKNRKVGAITVSLAGVLTNFLLAFVFALPFIFAQRAYVAAQTESMRYFLYFCASLCEFMIVLNVSFGLFNLLPLFPLDGYRLVSCFVDEGTNKFMIFMRRYSLYILLGLVVWDTLCDYIPVLNLFSPIYWYIQWLGTTISNGFIKFWLLLV